MTIPGDKHPPRWEEGDAPTSPTPWRERYRAYVNRELGSIEAWERVNAEQGLQLYPQMIENRAVLLSLQRLFDVLEKSEQAASSPGKTTRKRP